MHTLAIVSVVFLLTVAFYEIVYKLIARFLWNKFSIVKDVHLLSKERPKDQKFSGTALICGGSLSGLFSARVCANHFEKVIIIEPEQWVAVGEKGLEDHHNDLDAPKRSRVAQYEAYHHFHVFMTLAMQEMFSTFEQAMKKAGARLTYALDILYACGIPKITPTNFPYYSGGVYPKVMNMSRPAFETTLRRLVLETCKGVQYFHGTITGLLYDETLNRVSGVSVKLPSGETIELEATFVVDATGSFMGGHRWLKDIPKFATGHSPSFDDLKVSFNPKVSYTIAKFALPPQLEEDLRQYGFPAQDDTVRQVHYSLPMIGPDNRIFFIDKREKNHLHVGCGGYDWHGEIRNVGDVEDFLRKLNTKRPLPYWMHDLVHSLQSKDVPVSFVNCKYASSVYIKYHEAKSLPSNFVVVGDAQSRTDPILGQGSSKACATAIILNAQLHGSIRDAVGYLPSSFARKYFLDVKDRTEHIWINMRNIDYKYLSTIPLPGDNLKTTARLLRDYADTVFALSTKDSDISRAFTCHVAWLEPPIYILAPWIARRVVWAWIKELFGYEIL